jgi:hypothetical protein
MRQRPDCSGIVNIRLINQCHSSADPRKAEFERLRTSLLAAKQVIITTAGALRSSISLVEELRLINQPQQNVIQLQSFQTDKGVKNRIFRGALHLSAIENMALGRTILVLDAVIRECDYSGATFKAWLSSVNTQPLRNLLRDSKGAHPSIRSFLGHSRTRGIKLDIEPMLPDLVNIWSTSGKMQINPERVRSLIENYYPVAFKIKPHELMQPVFETARKHLKEME